VSHFENGFALIIGVANYPKVRKLPASVLKDAQDIHDLLRSPSHCGYPAENTRLLLDDQATLENIREGLRWLAQSASANDTGLVFFSGHGGRLTSGPQAGNYLIPFDCDPNAPLTTALPGQELTEMLRQIKAQRLLVLFDACYSGGTGETKDLMSDQPELKSGLDEKTYEQLAQGTGRIIMASSRTDETSLVLSSMQNSLFTHYLLEALRGNARTRGDGLLRIFDVFEYVSEQVPARGNQHPIFKAADLENNFPIALYVGGKQLSPATAPAASHKTVVDKRALREAMISAFNLEELKLLCADVEQDLADDGIQIAVNLEVIEGNTKSGKVLGMIEYLDRRRYLSYLVRAVRLHRPGIL
jgi:metacaspase-1